MNDFARKDFFVCLGIWLALEIVCFALLPLLNLTAPWKELQPWFLFSLLLGIGGAILTAGSSQLASFFRSQDFFASKKRLSSLISASIGWLGLVGISFPLFVISLQIFSKILSILKS